MAYRPYVTEEQYREEYGGKEIPEEEQGKYLRCASRHIDTLTYNRIVGRGISSLTDFQQDIIREVVCRQAEFEYQHRDVFGMILQGYSINGVSMAFGESWNTRTEKGIPIRKDDYELLNQTGLCCRLWR